MILHLKRPNKKNVALAVALILLAVVGGACGFFAYKSWQLQKELTLLKTTSPPVNEAEAKQQSQQLKAEINKFLLLPDEEPTIATVLDATALQTNPFFKNAKNGDKVLLFVKAQKALIYRQNEQKVIEVGYFNPNEGQTNQGLTQTTGMKVAIRNGSGSTQKPAELEKLLLDNFPTTTVVERGTPKRTDYKGAEIIDVTGKNAKDVQTMSAKLGLTIATLAPDEATTAADVLIILGK